MAMTTDLSPLIGDLVEWLGDGSRSRAETLEAWRTSCPRLTVIEDALDAGYVERDSAGAFHATDKGRALAAERSARR